MSAEGSGQQRERTKPPAPFDTSVAHPARVYDFWLGGKDHYPADREAGQKVLDINPGLAEGVRSNRAFLARTVRYLVGEAGVRQILDIGTGLPSMDNVHEVAQEVDPDTKVVYVDNDPIVNVHAQALLTGRPGTVDYVDADLRDVRAVLDAAATTIDFSRPVAVIILMTMQFIPEEDRPYDLVREYLDACPPGSYLVVSHPALDPSGVANQATSRYNQMVSTGMTRRTPDEIARFFEGLELVPPGLVTLHDWRPDSARAPLTRSPALGAVGRKP